jgi:hypothetical protein
MRDLPGFDNVAYFDSEWERELFISNVEGISDVVLTKLDVIIRDDVPMYPIHLVFTDDPVEPGPIAVKPIMDTPF